MLRVKYKKGHRLRTLHRQYLLVLVSIAPQRPDREHIAIGRVRDPARTIEHARDGLLVPVTRRALSMAQEVNASVDRGLVIAVRRHQSEQRPRSLHHAAVLFTKMLTANT